MDNALRLLERKSGDVVAEYSESLTMQSYLSAGVFSTDQTALLTGSEDGHLLMYDILNVRRNANYGRNLSRRTSKRILSL